MAISRTVTMPLGREPEILFGLRLADLFWVMAGAVGELAAWHVFQGWGVVRIVAMGLVGAMSLTLALVRLNDATLPEWGMRWARYILSPHLYLP